MADKKHSDSTHDEKIPDFETSVPYGIDYKPKLLNSLIPSYQGAVFVNGNNNIVLNANGVTQSLIQIPRGAIYDFSKSFMRFDMDFAAPGAAIFTKVWMHKPPIESLVLRTTGGKVLVDIQDFPYYWLMTRCAVSRNDFLRNGTPAYAAASANAVGCPVKFHNPSGRGFNTPMAALTVNNQKVQPNIAGGNQAPAVAAPAITAGDTCPVIVVSSDANATIGFRCEISFEQLIFTLLSCPKLIPLEEDLQLEINFQAINRIAFTDTAVGTINTAPAAYGGAVTLSNLSLELAKESNPLVIQAIKTQVPSGVRIVFPKCMRVMRQQSNVFAAATNTVTIGNLITTAAGANLLRVFSCEFNANENLAMIYNAWNLVGAAGASQKVTEFKHRLNNEDYDNERLNTGQARDWMRVKNLLSGSCVDAGEYYTLCPSYVLQLSGQERLIDCPREDFSYISGFPLASFTQTNVQKELTINTGAAIGGNTQILTFMYAVGQDTLFITPNMVGILDPSTVQLKPALPTPGVY